MFARRRRRRPQSVSVSVGVERVSVSSDGKGALSRSKIRELTGVTRTASACHGHGARSEHCTALAVQTTIDYSRAAVMHNPPEASAPWCQLGRWSL